MFTCITTATLPLLLLQGPARLNTIWQSTRLHGAFFQGVPCLLLLHKLELSVCDVSASWHSGLA